MQDLGGLDIYDPDKEKLQVGAAAPSPTMSTLPIVPPSGQQTLATTPGAPMPGTPTIPADRGPMAGFEPWWGDPTKMPGYTPGGPQPPAPISVNDPRATAPQTPEAAADQYGTLPDVEELRADPYTAKYEQSAIARADELSSERFNTLRQQRANEMARQGIGPDSPFWQSEMRKIDQGQAVESSNFRRNLELDKVQQRYSRLAQARTVEAQQAEMERQQLADLYAMVSGTPYQPSNALAQMMAIQGQRANEGASAMGSGAQGIGDLIAAYMATNRQPQTLNFANPAPAPAPPPWMRQMYPGTWE